jgi:hypothetical protein
MATTTNYGWTTPDDTALVKDGASAIRTLGSSVDTTTKNLNPSTTLGDIEYRSATANTNTRLGIGTTGQVLSVVGGVPAWATASAGANWSLLNSGGTALTGAQTVTVSSISGKDKIMILIQGASSASTSTINVRINTDTASNYYPFGILNYFTGSYNVSNFSYKDGSAVTSIPVAELADSSGESWGYVSLSGCNSSGVKVFEGLGGVNGGSGKSQVLCGGYYNSSSTVSSVSIFSTTGNLDAGTVYVYASA